MSKNNETSTPKLKRSRFQELKAEFAKITWPAKESLAKRSVLVMIVAVILGLIIAGVDMLLKFGLAQII